MNKQETYFVRFMKKVSAIKLPEQCWLWTASRNKKGYSRFWYKGKMVMGHRYIYEIYKGKIPKGLSIDHTCRNTSCVNPWHLEVITLRENILKGDGIAMRHKRKTHCSNGHMLGEYKNKRRTCMICKHKVNQKWKAKNKDKVKAYNKLYW